MSRSDKSVLLVEDEPNDVELVTLAFEKCDTKVPLRVVRDGAEALDYLFAQGKFADRAGAALPSVALLDLQLPKLGGLEVLKRLRADPRTRLLPVVILTSSSQDEDMQEAYRLGANSFVRKPVAFEQFSGAVCQLMLYWLQLNETPR